MTEIPLRDPWLVAVWPGMGGVAQLAGAQLAAKLGVEPLVELEGHGHFDVRNVEVDAGLVVPQDVPHGRLFAFRDPKRRRDLVLFVGEAQPDHEALRYCDQLIARAQGFGVTQVVTFAAMASNIAPDAEPRVMVAATTPAQLALWRERGADALQGGQIAGANGILLAAAQARGLPAVCLLGEIPYFAAQIPNPKASRAILRLFRTVAGLDIDLAELDGHVASIEKQLLRHLTELQRAAEADAPRHALTDAEVGADVAAEIDGVVRARIEALFDAARRDRREAVALKRFLDENGLFARYEDRFLDLFRKAG